MTIRFSAALPAARNHPARGCGFNHLRSAANDNPRDVRNDPVLRAALRHFAICGLGAASDARNRALAARADGDQAGYSWWLAICAQLDRRLAQTISHTVSTQ